MSRTANEIAELIRTFEQDKTEGKLVAFAREVTSNLSWEQGAAASAWTTRWARGRTDADFGNLIGLTGDQVFQRRRVWDVFGGCKDIYTNISWTHFLVALTWPDATECLKWADEQDATVAEMKAWRRMQHGEDLTTEAVDDEPRVSEAMTPSVAHYEDEPLRPTESAAPRESKTLSPDEIEADAIGDLVRRMKRDALGDRCKIQDTLTLCFEVLKALRDIDQSGLGNAMRLLAREDNLFAKDVLNAASRAA